MKRILLTGATGYLGQHVLARFMSELDNSYQIFALHSGNGGSAAFEEAVRNFEAKCLVKVETLDLTDSIRVHQWVAAHSPMDLCLHAAAVSSPRVCQNDPERATAVNVPESFLESLAEQKIPTVVLSTDQVYRGDKEDLYQEMDTPGPVNIYGETKVALEHKLKELFEPKRIPFVALRSSILCGPHVPISEAHGTFLHFVASRENQETTFYVDEIRNVVSVHNVVSVLYHFVTHGIKSSGIYNMGGRDPVSRLDMATAVFRYLQYDPKGLMPATRANLPSSGIKSPLDISMDSSMLEQLTGIDFWGLDKIVQKTFPSFQDF